MSKILIAERQLPLLKQVLKERGMSGKIVIISERQIPLLKQVLSERKRLDEARLLLTEDRLDWNTEYDPEKKIYQFKPCQMPNVSSYNAEKYPKNPNITQYLNKNGVPVYFYQKSQRENNSRSIRQRTFVG